MVSPFQVIKIVKSGVDMAGDGIAAYQVTKKIVGDKRMEKLKGTVANAAKKQAARLIDPKLAQDPENAYLKTIAELNAVLERDALADFKTSETGPDDAQVLSALLRGEEAIANLVSDWRASNGLERCTAIGDTGVEPTGNLVNQMRGYVYDKRKMSEIKSLESRIANRERVAIAALAADPLAAAMTLDRPKVFAQLLEAAASAYCFGKRDPERQDRFVWLTDPVTGERHKIFGKANIEPERDGTTLLHKAAVMDNSFYMEALLMTAKKPQGATRKPAAGKASGQNAGETGPVEAFRIEPVQKIVRMPEAIVDAVSARDGDGDTPLMLRARKLDFGMVGKILAHPDFNKDFDKLSGDGSSLFDIVYDTQADPSNPKHAAYKTALSRVTALLAVLSDEQKKVLLNTKNGNGEYPLSRVATHPALALLLINAGAREPVGLFTDLAAKLKPEALLSAAKDIAATARGHMPEAAGKAVDTAMAAGSAAVDAATAAIAAHAPEMQKIFSRFMNRLKR